MEKAGGIAIKGSPAPAIGMQLKAQGAIELSLLRSSTAGTLLGQGATEYLVLLAVVLIVALVSVALLGFFPAMASDTQITQSQMYWQSATPIAITESAARYDSGAGYVRVYIRVANTGAYPIRITGVVGADGGKATVFYGSGAGCGFTGGPYFNISDYFYLGPGEQAYFSRMTAFGSQCDRIIYPRVGTSNNEWIGSTAVCQNSSASPGMLDYKSFGFEYRIYMEGQQITKRQIGKELLIKCLPPG